MTGIPAPAKRLYKKDPTKNKSNSKKSTAVSKFFLIIASVNQNMPNNPITPEQVSQRLFSISEYCHVLVSTELHSSGYTHTSMFLWCVNPVMSYLKTLIGKSLRICFLNLRVII